MEEEKGWRIAKISVVFPSVLCIRMVKPYFMKGMENSMFLFLVSVTLRSAATMS